MDGIEMKRILRCLMFCLLVNRTYTHNVTAEEPQLRHPRVNGRIVKLYSGVKPDPILCASEGFQADPVNCAVFYRCVKGASNRYTVFRYQCGPGTVYDPETEICNHPMNTKRANCGGRSFPPSASINDNEIDGFRQEVPSPFTTKPPVYTEQSTTNKFATTFSTRNVWSSSSDKKISPSFPISTIYPWVNNRQQTQATESPVFQKLRQQEGEPCTTDGFMGDSEDCRRFFRCVGNGRGGYIRYEFSCSDLTIWDDDAKACNHAWAVKRRRCGRVNPDDDKIIKSTAMEENEVFSDRSMQSQLQINYGTKVNQIQTQISKGSVIQNQTQINYGNSSNRNSDTKVRQNQTQISHGSAVSQTQTQINRGNNAIQTQLQIDHTKESSQSQTQINEANSEQTPENDETQEPSTQKPNGNGDDQCTQSGFMGDSKNCKKFYRCVDNGRGSYIRYEFSCGEGTVWDPSAEACNHEWAVKDCKNKDTSGTTSQDTKTSTTKKPPTQHTTTTSDEEDVGYGGQNQEHTSTSTTQQDKPITTTESTTKATQVSTTMSSSAGDSAGNVCTSSGFMGDSKDCQKFYRCVDNGKGGLTKYEYKCGEGTVWDTEIDACNHPWAVKTCGGGSSTDNTETSTSSRPITEIQTSTTSTGSPNEDYDTGYGQPQNEPTTITTPSSTTSRNPPSEGTCSTEGFFGDTKDCRKFYRCVENQQGGFTKYDFTCGEGTMWDSEINACNHEKSVKNGCSSSSSNTETTQKQPVNENDEYDESSTSESTTTAATTQAMAQKPSSSSNKCDSEGFFANPDDCKKFYRCVDDGKGGFTKYDFSCGDGTVWDDQAQTCNHETSQSKCSQSSASSASEKPQTDSETTTQKETDNEPTTSKKPHVDSTTSSSKDQCSSEGFYASSNDCKKFYRCVDNGKGGFTKYDFSCGEGTVWVQEIQACDHDNDISNCSSQMVSSTSSYQEEIHSSTDSSTSGQSSTTEKQNNEISNDQSEGSTGSNECQSEGFYPNKNDCRKFYRCVDNGNGGFTSYDFTCGEGTAWDSELQTCNHINEVKNCQGSSNQNEQESGTDTENSSQTTESTSTTKTSTTSSTTESSGENKPSTGNDKCEKEGYFGDSNNCKKFYRCVDNGKGGLTKYDYTCGEGTIWDQDIQTCNHPGDVQNPSCNNNNSGETTQSPNDGSSSTTSGSSTTSSESSPSSSSTESQDSSDCSQSSTQKPPNKNVNCTKAGFYADPDDCKKFYRCVDWDNNGKRFSVYHFDCGEGTIWDPELETCNHEESVYPPRDCSGSQSQGQNESSSTTTENSTTSESTTQESTTTDSTTEKSTTTTESTTTEQSSTTEQTTTEKSTTQQSSTSTTEKTTTQSSTTEESTTTEQTSTTEQSTTEQSSTQESTTKESTTQESTTKESTTQESTTKESTTQESTTKESTTQESTTEESTTQASTTEESTTEQSTTEQSTTEQSTTEQTTESSTEQSSTTQESSTTDATESSTAEQSSTTEESSSSTTEDNQESTTESSSDSKECPETEDDQYVYVCPTSFRRHPKYCNMFYQCTEEDDSHDLHIAVFKCPNNTIYDESQTKCVDKDKAEKKCEGEIEERKRVKRLNNHFKDPIVVSKESMACPGRGHYPFEKSECSPAFLKCDKTKSGRLRGYVHRCPEGYVYWSISRRCERKASVRDCKLTANDWRGRWEIPTERKNVAY